MNVLFCFVFCRIRSPESTSMYTQTESGCEQVVKPSNQRMWYVIFLRSARCLSLSIFQMVFPMFRPVAQPAVMTLTLAITRRVEAGPFREWVHLVFLLLLLVV